jgi:hypothetical protein
MQQQKLTIEESITIGQYKVTPVVSTSVNYAGHTGRHAYYASRKPVYLIITAGKTTTAYTMEGAEIPVSLVEAAVSRHGANQKAS